MELQKRWTANERQAVLAAMASGAMPSSPFGRTAEGRLDLRGLVCAEALILNGLTLVGVDFSYSSFQKLLCLRCELTDCVFDHAKLVLLNNGSKINRCAFVGSRLKTSSSGGPATFDTCIFRECDLTGCIFQEGIFASCRFETAKVENAEFGSCKFKSCSFAGVIAKSFFRGMFKDCDLGQATFLDCAFYGAEFEGCLLSDRALLFDDWQTAFAIIRSRAPVYEFTVPARQAVERWCSVWAQIVNVVKQELIDERSLVLLEGEQVGKELFAFLKEVAEFRNV